MNLNYILNVGSQLSNWSLQVKKIDFFPASIRRVDPSSLFRIPNPKAHYSAAQRDVEKGKLTAWRFTCTTGPQFFPLFVVSDIVFFCQFGQ